MDENSEKIISGGPMMGTAMFSLDVPVVKGSSCLLVLKKDPVNAATMTNCLNCGKCVSVCPQGLICANLAKAAAANDKEAFEKYYGMECIECGTCNYICPAKRNITQAVRTMKRQIIADRKKNS
jgi:electron transport complex protein RnfC